MNHKPRPAPASAGLAALLAVLLVACAPTTPEPGDVLVISVVGTNDVHGAMLPADDRGGLAMISGYVNALRAARADGAVVLVDAGDMWQGTLESNLGEGKAVVDIYNAMGYAAAAIGNHEFDFGPAGPAATPRDGSDDPRGALKERASEARFPLLAANLIDADTGEPVSWDNVRPSILTDAAGVRVGIVGVVTIEALDKTIAANTGGLEVAPLAPTIEREAQRLRANGAELVIVAAHAGGRCAAFDDPADLGSCDRDAEIVPVANALPHGLVDHIVAGHVHQGIAHEINGIAVTSAYSRSYAISRVDFLFDRTTRRIVARRIHPPQSVCPYRDDSGQCALQSLDGPARYEGRPVLPDPDVLAIALAADRAARVRRAEKLGTTLELPFTLEGNPESVLGNLFTDAVLEAVDGDVAIHNVSGGIRATLPAGELTFGDVYEVFPFDNRVVVLDMSGRELRQVITAEARKTRRRAGFSGLRVSVRCERDSIDVDMTLGDGRPVRDDDRVRVVVNDFLALGGDGILAPVMPPGGFDVDTSMPLTRDVLVAWLRGRGTLRVDDFDTRDRPKWQLPATPDPGCELDLREDGPIGAGD